MTTRQPDGPATVSLEFNGTRISVFFILPNKVQQGAINAVQLSFYLDQFSSPAGHFYHTTNGALGTYIYNQLVFSSELLHAGNHSLLISSWSDGTTGSLALFDYAVYTTSNIPTPISPSIPAGTDPRTNTIAIIGSAVVGGLVLLIVLAIVVYRICSQQRAAVLRPIPPPTDPQLLSMRLLNSESKAGRKTSTAPESARSRGDNESFQLRSEMSLVREELERVRQMAEPPEYVGHN
ncbi:hypothetical protein AURDEDRAFT_136842 [Auricularia subglabra TFB-10046 SS5]|nr:hypothetical protein AURDEDRAFT_136842 [Auricularia subglabra TFB-10046 SS5]